MKKLEFGKHTFIMGILNVTPDSFYDGGKYSIWDRAVQRAEKMLEDGADIIDIGGESTRPGAESVSLEEELDRVIPVIEAIRDFPIPISIDTYKAKVAAEALKHGASIVNDISGLRFDPEMAKVVAKYNVPVIIMHIKGTPRDMQKNPHYENVVEEIKNYFIKQIDYAISFGIKRGNIILDPGIGFGKKLEHNIEILRNINEFKKLGFPLLIGHSRKSMIGMILDGIPPEERLYGTLAISSYCIMNKVHIIRVHDVKEHVHLRKILEAIVGV